MIYIGICDDIAEHRESIKEICDKYFVDRKIKYKPIMFHSGEDVLAYEGDSLMLLFLDIELGGITGIDVMHRMLHSDRIWRILFVSCHDEYMLETFGLKTLGYCPKPVQYKTVYQWLDIAMEEYDCNKVIQFDRNVVIAVDDIIYIQADSHYIHVFTVNKPYVFVMDIRKAEALLEGTSVVRIHRSYMVNMAYISNYTAKLVKLHGEGIQLPIGRSYTGAVREKFKAYLYETAKRRLKE
ncbi:MAG: LytTR family DNA-binding domain-containing protein [Clostridium sp.]|nr:LytTR family DNA-binding domain-containing protein [Clostridium sp.]MCM1399963.1 LytTR family DNA-binding domain-containing protein [Clostridium sp.]MCM1460296.1 LytTR family DNA-binding domain-containing protein [Bacteroides sp.]